ncbi:MAG: hypothetical protein JWP66_823 [Naasia sp.]|nr:hypothetical protein [Naasia sp.]
MAYNGYDSGLGNRIRVTLGGQSLAEAEGRDFFYVWPTGELFGAQFSDLWEYRAPVLTRAVSRLLARRWDYVDHNVSTWLTDAKRRERLWQIRTGSEIALPDGVQPWQDRFRKLVPASQIADRVNRFFDERLRGVPYAGVMVRAHSVSHQRTKDASPVEWFIDKMRAVREREPDIRFFISCDVPEVQARIKREIPGTVGLTDKGGYNTLDGVRSSVTDLYLLASAGQLIGPHFSSFIHLARYLVEDRLPLSTSALDPGPVRSADLPLATDPLRPAARAWA